MSVGDIFRKIRGISGTIFQIGPWGPQLKSESTKTALAARNAADDGYALMRGADPVGTNDLVTLGYFNTNNAAAQGLTYAKMSLGTSTAISSSSLPNNAVIMEARVEVTTAYSAGTSMQVSRTGDGTKVMCSTSDLDPTVQGTHMIGQVTNWGSTGAGTVTVTISGSPVAGASVLYIGYVTPTSL